MPTTTDTEVNELIINTLTKEQYNTLVANNQVSANELYLTKDEEFYTKVSITYGTTTYAQITAILGDKSEPVCFYNNYVYNYAGNDGTYYYLTCIVDTSSKYIRVNSSNVWSNGAATITPVNNSIITIQKNSTIVDTFSLNQSTNQTINITVPVIDNSTINTNSNSQIQTVGVKDVRTTNTLKVWTGTKQQYDAITTKDANTLYNITDDADSTSVASLLSQVQTQINNVYNSITSTVLDMVYPVGSIYLSVNNVNPATLFGGTWVQIKDTFLLAAGDTYSNGGTGGSADAVVVSHNHTQNAHSHKPASTSLKFLVSDTNVAINGTKRAFPASGTSAYFVYASDPGSGINEDSTTQSVTATNIATGAAATGKNMPPYLAVNIWRRES